MTITRDNYEPYFLDFLEGRLEEVEIDQFLDFLNQNPDLKEELQLFESFCMPEEHIVFPDKNQLYKQISDQKAGVEIRIIAYLEGDLSAEDRTLFEADQRLDYELKKETDLFTKTRLTADAGIKFTGKKKFYRSPGSTRILNWLASAAAVLVLLWAVGSRVQIGTPEKQKESVQVIAEIKIPEVPPKKLETTEVVSETKLQRKEESGKRREFAQVTGITESSGEKPVEHILESSIMPARDSMAVHEISPKLAQLDSVPAENRLTISKSIPEVKDEVETKSVTLDEILTSKVKKIGDEGILSAKRIARAGLNAVSEISGDRIDFRKKDGKISNIRFESKLLAFSIPLKKK